MGDGQWRSRVIPASWMQLRARIPRRPPDGDAAGLVRQPLSWRAENQEPVLCGGPGASALRNHRATNASVDEWAMIEPATTSAIRWKS